MNENRELDKACKQWWVDLSLRAGDRARLRRSASIADALMVPSTHRLADALRPLGFTSVRRTAMLASLLAQANSCGMQGDSLPQLLGKSQGDRAVLSENRFRRLIRASDDEDLFLQLRRAIRILDGRAHLPSLVEAVRYWSFDPDKRSQTLTKWACDYYGKATFSQSA